MMIVSGWTLTQGLAQVYDITAFGASPELPDNGPAIRRAIAAAKQQGGGTIQVPAGVFRSGALRMDGDGIHLSLMAGAVLQADATLVEATQEPDSRPVFIRIESAHGVTITGPGTIRGTGQDTLAVSRFHPFPAPAFRYDLVQISDCQGVRVRDLNLVESELFTLNLHHCEDVVIDGVIIRNNYFHPNTDAIDLEECHNVHISNCHLTAGDDGICFKEGSERVVITNCTIETPSTGIKFGTSTTGTFRYIRVSNCVIYNAMVGVGMFMKDGGLIEHCSFSDLIISNIEDTLLVGSGIVHQQIPLYIDVDLRDEQSPAGVVRHISFTDIDINSEHPMLIQGLKAQPIEDLTLRDIRIHIRRGYDLGLRKKPKGFSDKKFWYHDDHRLTAFVRQPHYATIANVHGLMIEGLTVQVHPEIHAAHPRQVLGLYGVKDMTVNGLHLIGPVSSEADLMTVGERAGN
jgi:polygalacturonase